MNILIALHAAEDNSIQDILYIMDAKGLSIEEYNIAYSKKECVEILKQNKKIDVVLVSLYLEKEPFTLSDFEAMTDANINVQIIPIINQTSDVRFEQGLCNLGILNAIYNDDAKIEAIISLIKHPRTRKEAKQYYGIKTSNDTNVVDNINLQQYVHYVLNGEKGDIEKRIQFLNDRLREDDFNNVMSQVYASDLYKSLNNQKRSSDLFQKVKKFAKNSMQNKKIEHINKQNVEECGILDDGEGLYDVTPIEANNQTEDSQKHYKELKEDVKHNNIRDDLNVSEVAEEEEKNEKPEIEEPEHIHSSIQDIEFEQLEQELSFEANRIMSEEDYDGSSECKDTISKTEDSDTKDFRRLEGASNSKEPCVAEETESSRTMNKRTKLLHKELARGTSSNKIKSLKNLWRSKKASTCRRTIKKGTTSIFITALHHGCGSSHFALTIANYLDVHNNSVCIVTDSNYIARYMEEYSDIPVFKCSDDYSMCFSNFDYVIFDCGIYSELQSKFLMELRRSHLLFMMCWDDPDYLSKLAKFVERGNYVEQCLFVFNNVPDSKIHKISRVMENYDSCCLPNYDAGEITDEVCEILEQIL